MTYKLTSKCNDEKWFSTEEPLLCSILKWKKVVEDIDKHRKTKKERKFYYNGKEVELNNG
jgi:hypothetical protein